MIPQSVWRYVAAVGAVAFAAALGGIGVRSSHAARLTGDEPHYLLTAISLWDDASLDVSDEHADERYRDFHEVPLAPQGTRQDGGRIVAPHDPLLPALLAVPAGLGGWVGAKVAMGLIGAVLAGLLVWTEVRRLRVEPARAAAVVGVFSASAPFAVYGTQLYPELPAALAVAAAFAAVTGSMRAGAMTAFAAAVIALPWLGVKYAPVAAAIAAVGAWRLWRARRMRALVLLGGAFAVAGVAFLTAHLAWYGGPTPYAAGRHFVTSGELGVVGTQADLLGRSRRLVGLMVDRTFGLAAWQPAWLLVIPAVAATLRRRPAGWDAILVPLAVGWLVATFVALTMHGWWSPGRQVVVVLPLAVLAVAWWCGSSRARVGTVTAFGVLGVLSYLWVIAEGVAGRVTWAVDFFETTDPVYRLRRLLLPDYLEVTATTWFLHGVWIAAFAAAVVWAWKWVGAGRGPAPTKSAVTSP